MKLKCIFGAVAVFLIFTAIVAPQSPSYRISAPYTHKNLTIYLIHGKDETSKTNILTLQEAMDRRLFRVYETSDVNQLAVENISKTFDVFIQSGDIVKGGKQDRILGVSIIIPARSGTDKDRGVLRRVGPLGEARERGCGTIFFVKRSDRFKGTQARSERSPLTTGRLAKSFGSSGKVKPKCRRCRCVPALAVESPTQSGEWKSCRDSR